MNAASWPSPAEEELIDTLSFAEWLVPRQAASCLITVATAALRREGILPGDTAIMERGRAPRSGDIVVAEVNGAPIIRRYEHANKQPQLADDTGAAPLARGSEARLLGVVTAIIRRYR